MRTGQVVVGLNESPSGTAALQRAAHRAKAPDSDLRAVHIFERPFGRSCSRAAPASVADGKLQACIGWITDGR